MTDREKAIKGLEKIAEFFKARGDMAVGDGKMLLLSWMRAAEDAIALLEAQEPIDGDTISRSALLADYDAAHKGPPGGARKLIEEAPAVVLKAQEPRVLSAAEFAAMESGVGWLENCHTWDDICIERFAWVCGDTICEAGYSTKETLLGMYNLPDGVRVWVGHTQPSEDQRKAVAWDG